jgi:hypothetical protein
MRLSFFTASFLMTAGLLFVSCDKPGPERSVTLATNAPAAAPEASPRFTRLLGRWERPDGGYVLALNAVDPQGKLDANYFNPGSIRVERALALSETGATKVFVLLRDENYPGCTYSLTYDEKADQLYGQYFQASQQQTYDVVFARLPAQP